MLEKMLWHSVLTETQFLPMGVFILRFVTLAVILRSCSLMLTTYDIYARKYFMANHFVS